MKKLRMETNGMKKLQTQLFTPSRNLKLVFSTGFLEIWASPDPFSLKFSIVLKTPDKTLSFMSTQRKIIPDLVLNLL